MTENKDKTFDLTGALEKIQKELKGNKYLKSILKSIGLNDVKPKDDVDEGIIKAAIGGVALDFVLTKLNEFFSGVKDDLEDLLGSDNLKDSASALFKLATKAYIVALFLGVVVDEIEKIAKGKKEPEQIDYKKLQSDMDKIDSKL